MKTLAVTCALLLVVRIVQAAEPKDEVQNAAKMLGEKSGYSWKSTVNSFVQSRFRQGPAEGKTEKGGFTALTMSFGDNSLEAVLKDGKGAIKTQDGWQSLSDAVGSTDQQNAGRFIGRSLQTFKVPAEQAADLATKTYGIRKQDDYYSGDLNQEALKQLMAFGRRPTTGADAPEPMIRDAAGTVKFWIKDGVLTKYEFAVKGIVSIGGSDRNVDRMTTVEIKDVGSTKVEVADEAKSKAS